MAGEVAAPLASSRARGVRRGVRSSSVARGGGREVRVEVDVVVHVADEVGADARAGARGVLRVLDELALAHLVLHVRTRQVGREQQQTEAQDVHGACAHDTSLLILLIRIISLSSQPHQL